MPIERTTTETLYSYEELAEFPEAQERARDKIGSWNAEWEGENLSYQFELILEEQGFPTDKIEYSLGHSQGDGVAFYGSIDVNHWLTVNKRLTYYRTLRTYDPYARIDKNSWGTHYSHYNTMDVIAGASFHTDWWPFEDNTTDRKTQMLGELRYELEESVQDMSHKLEKFGYDIIEHAYSDEAVRESCEANEHLFTEEGEIA